MKTKKDSVALTWLYRSAEERSVVGTLARFSHNSLPERLPALHEVQERSF